MPAKKSWNEKLADAKGLPRVVPIPPRMAARWGVGTLAIPAPCEVDELMRQVPKGKLTTTHELRAALARRHGATLGCPLTTGIFAWIAAHAAAESAAAGRRRMTMARGRRFCCCRGKRKTRFTAMKTARCDAPVR